MTELTLRCTCGDVRGRLLDADDRNGTRVTCMCNGCQMYAHFLERPGDILGPNGDTEVYQTTPAQLRVDEGMEQIRLLRQTRNGAWRWYTQCCMTPLANTIGVGRTPFAGVVAAMYAHHSQQTIEASLGPIVGRTQAHAGYGELPADAHARTPFRVMARATRVLAAGALAGRHRPHPFVVDGVPIADARFYTAEERAIIEARARDWAEEHG